MLASLLLAALAAPRAPQAQGTLHTDGFIRGHSDPQPMISVTYVPTDLANPAKALVYVQSGADVVADPGRFELEPNAPMTVHLTLRNADFAAESVVLQSPCCANATVVIEPNVNHRLLISTPPEAHDREAFSVDVEAVDTDGKPLKCRAPLEVMLAPTSAQVRLDERAAWSPSATARVGPGNVLTARFQVRPAAVFGGQGDLNAQLRTVDGIVLLAKNAPFSITASLLVDILATIAGALVWTLFRILTAKPLPGRGRFNNRSPELLTALLAGVAAFFLALGLEKADLGVAVDKTHPWGFAVLGLVLSFGGVETFLRRATKSESPANSQPPPVATNEIVVAVNNLKRSIDKSFFGTGIEDERSLYSFVEKYVNPLYAGSHREEESIILTCRRVGKAAQLDLLLKTTLSTPPLDTAVEPIKVFYQEPLLPGLSDEAAVRKHQLVRMTFTMAGISYESNDERTHLVVKLPEGRAIPDDFPPEPIPIDVKIKGSFAYFGYKVEIPGSLRKGPFSYDARTVWLRPPDPDFFIFTMLRPTRVFNVDCHFPDDVLIQVGNFNLTAEIDSDSILPKPEMGNAHVRMGDWLLPGHGVVIVWGSLAEGPKSKT